MQIKKLYLKDKCIYNNVFLAPMAGYTDYAFRHLELKNGYGLSFTELVSAKGLFFGGSGTKDLLYCGEDKKNTAVQIFGNDSYYMRSACESEELKDFEIVDINMGCPVPKVFKNGEGSALLSDILRAEKIVKECVKSGKIITCKIRTGIKKGDNVAREYCKMIEQAGATLCTIHGRVRDAYYSGEVDYDAIAEAKKSVSIPIIANGGIFSKSDADLMIERTGADGVMIARGAVENPFLINEIINAKSSVSMKDFAVSQIEIMAERYGEKRAVLEFKKFICPYFKGKVNAKEFRKTVMEEQSLNGTVQKIEQFF